MSKKHRFQVVEHSSYYAVVDTATGKEAAMSDGVDVVLTPTGRSMSPGTEHFRMTWQRALNENEAETEGAYFGGTQRSTQIHD